VCTFVVTACGNRYPVDCSGRVIGWRAPAAGRATRAVRRRWPRRRWLLPPDDRCRAADAQAHLFALVQVPPPAVCLVCVCVCVATAASALVSAGARVVNGQTSLPRSSSSATRRARSLSLHTHVRRARVFPLFFFRFFFSIIKITRAPLTFLKIFFSLEDGG